MSITRIGIHSPEATLVYFDARGEAEVIRFLMTVTGTSYNEVHVKEEFTKEQMSSDDEYVSRHLPMLKIDGQKLATTDVIVKYLGRRAYPMLGDKIREASKVEQLYYGTRDFYKPFMKQEVFPTDKETFIKHIRSTVMEEYLTRFNKVLENNTGGPYMLGIHMCIADVALLEVLFGILDYCGIEDLENYYGLKLLLKSARNEKSVQFYLQKLRKPLRPITDELYLNHMKFVIEE